MSGFLGYLGEVESTWDNLNEVEEAPKPRKKVIKKKKVIKAKASDPVIEDDYERYLQLKKKFEREEYLQLKKKYEGADVKENDVIRETVKHEPTPHNPSSRAAFILDGVDESDTSEPEIVPNGQPAQPEVNLEEARYMSQEELNKLSPKTHASMLL